MNKKTKIHCVGIFLLGLLGIAMALACFFPSRLPFSPLVGSITLLLSLNAVIYSIILVRKTKKVK